MDLTLNSNPFLGRTSQTRAASLNRPAIVVVIITFSIAGKLPPATPNIMEHFYQVADPAPLFADLLIL